MITDRNSSGFELEDQNRKNDKTFCKITSSKPIVFTFDRGSLAEGVVTRIVLEINDRLTVAT